MWIAAIMVRLTGLAMLRIPIATTAAKAANMTVVEPVRLSIWRRRMVIISFGPFCNRWLSGGPRASCDHVFVQHFLTQTYQTTALCQE